jgi:hypothetical protein
MSNPMGTSVHDFVIREINPPLQIPTTEICCSGRLLTTNTDPGESEVVFDDFPDDFLEMECSQHPFDRATLTNNQLN